MTRRTLIALGIAVLAAAPLSAADVKEKRQELDRIQQERQERQRQIEQAARKERSVLSSLEKIDRGIQAGSEELREQQRRIEETEAALAGIESSSLVIHRELPALREAYARRLRALYKMSRTGGYALAVLSSDDLGTAYKRVRYLGTIAERDQRVISEYLRNLERLELQQRDTAAIKSGLVAEKQAAEKKRAALKLQRRSKSDLLASLQQEKSVSEATLKDLEESEANLWAMIRLAEREKQGAAKQAAGRRQLPWPVAGRVLSTFGAQRHPQFGTQVFRRGIEIAAKDGDEVRAVDGGVVAKADWFRGYGRLVIIDHRDGMYTLYGHLSQVDVKNGEQVARGQVIGRAGDTGSLKGTKLYFELRRNGEAEDPLGWLAKR